jgi:hypothetical protein
MSSVETKTMEGTKPAIGSPVPLSEVDPAMIVAGMKNQPVESKPSDSTASSGDGNRREYDVVCEKGRGDHERYLGNRHYRAMINQYKDVYNDLAPVERSSIIGNIIGSIKDRNGWFMQRDEESGKWGELSEEKVRKKVSDDLRREVRRKREKRSNSTMFSAKLKDLKEMEADSEDNSKDILQPVNDPRQTDVLFGPGARRHPGNKTYWRLMKMNLDRYIISPYGARSMISRSIVTGIREQNGRFLEQDPKTAIWYEITDKRAIEKTSHALSNKKYKTRKRNPEEPVGPHSSFTGYPHADLEDEGRDCFSDRVSEPSQDSDDSQSRAKMMSKKFRLMQRMVGPEFDDDDKESIPHAANILAMGFVPRRGPDSSLDKKPHTPSSPPVMTKEQRVIVSPLDSRSSVSDMSREDYHDYDTVGYRRGRVPSVPEAGPPSDYHRYRKSEIGPRLGHYDVYGDEGPYHGGGVSYKRSPASPYAGHHMHGDYAPVRRYADHHGPPPPPVDAEYLSPRAAERTVLKARTPSGGGYWVRDWGSPSARRAADESTGWH